MFPPTRWLLGEQGRAQSLLLAERLRPYRPEVVITSQEPKAAETGEIVAERLNLPLRSAPGLHERDRTGVPYFDDVAEFEKMMGTFFERSAERVSGGESADEARQRFGAAVQRVLEPHPEQTVVIVAHGTANTLFVAAHNPVEPFAFWQAWALGTFAVLSRPDFGLLEAPTDHE